MSSPENSTPQDSAEQADTPEMTRRDKMKLAGVLGALAVGYVGVFGGYIESRSTGPMSGRATFHLTPKGEEAVAYVGGVLESAADTVTGLFRTAPDENGETVEFYIDEGTPQPPASEQGE